MKSYLKSIIVYHSGEMGEPIGIPLIYWYILLFITALRSQIR